MPVCLLAMFPFAARMSLTAFDKMEKTAYINAQLAMVLIWKQALISGRARIWQVPQCYTLINGDQHKCITQDIFTKHLNRRIKVESLI